MYKKERTLRFNFLGYPMFMAHPFTDGFKTKAKTADEVKVAIRDFLKEKTNPNQHIITAMFHDDDSRIWKDWLSFFTYHYLD